MKLFYSSLFVTLLIFLSACNKKNSKDVTQDRIYTDYELFYNSNTDKTTVVARFRFGGSLGTLLELTDPAYALFNGDTLQYGALYSGHYKEYAGRISSGSFKYINIDGASFTNTVLSYDTITFPAMFDTISKSNAHTLTWGGNALAQNESAALFIGSWTWGQDALFVQNQASATNLVLGVDKLVNLPIGNSTFYMDRYKLSDAIDAPLQGGQIRSKFRAKNIEVYVKP